MNPHSDISAASPILDSLAGTTTLNVLTWIVLLIIVVAGLYGVCSIMYRVVNIIMAQINDPTNWRE